MVKDQKRRFETSPIWGDGWGWALFDAKDPSTMVTKSYEQECRSCHVPAQQTDWVYVQGYPTLGWSASTEIQEPESDRAPDDLPDGPVVTIDNLRFTPSDIRVRRGQTITWVNRDDFVHTATEDNGAFDTGNMAPGERKTVTFDDAGTFGYYCTPHPFMKATVVVEE